MAGFNDLVNVSFRDATNHVATTGDDILGVVMPYFWGPTLQPKVYNRNTFYETFPESLPLNTPSSGNVTKEYFTAYAQIKSFFRNGGALVQVIRPELGVAAEKYRGIMFDNAGDLPDYYVTLKYKGAIPASLLPQNAKNARILITGTAAASVVSLQYTLLASPSSPTDWTTLESWEGQWTDESATDAGQYTHFIHVLQSSSFLRCVVAETGSTAETDIVANGIVTTDYTSGLADITESGPTLAITNALKTFEDADQTNPSVIINTFKGATERTTYMTLAKNCKRFLYFEGWNPSAATPSPTDYDISASRISAPDSFTNLVMQREQIILFGFTVTISCVGGVVGATFKVAQDVRINQCASAKTYGAYDGVLVDSISFTNVLEYHKRGLITVYGTSTGPQIFGIHNTQYLLKPNGYFSLLNVMRVTSCILRLIIPMAFEAIHTDTAANPITRSVFETGLKSVIQQFSSDQNLQPDSDAYCTAEMNTDTLTKGGKYLNILLRLHYIGLTEFVNIQIVATDSSVTVEIV